MNPVSLATEHTHALGQDAIGETHRNSKESVGLPPTEPISGG